MIKIKIQKFNILEGLSIKTDNIRNVTKVLEDKTIDLTCPYRNDDNTKVKWILSNNQTYSGRFIEQENGALRISSVTQGDSGSYKCQVSNQNVETELYHTLLVISKPHIIVGPEDALVTVGDAITFYCDVLTNDNFTNVDVIWKHNDEKIDIDENTRYSFNDHHFIKITNVDKSDQGKYTCVYSTEYGDVEAMLELEVKYKPPKIIRPPKNLEVNYGHYMVILPCVVEYPELDLIKVKWLKGDEEIDIENNAHYSKYHNGLQIWNVRKEDENKYTCSVHADGYVVRASAYLSVIILPLAPPSSIKSRCHGRYVTFDWNNNPNGVLADYYTIEYSNPSQPDEWIPLNDKISANATSHSIEITKRDDYTFHLIAHNHNETSSPSEPTFTCEAGVYSIYPKLNADLDKEYEKNVEVGHRNSGDFEYRNYSENGKYRFY